MKRITVFRKRGHPCSGRFLIYEDGKPFFYLGDTAWELFHRLSREEVDLYLMNRKEKGFTVIQAVVLAELDGLSEPNYYGESPLIDKDPSRPNEKYFQFVDYVVNKAEELGIFIGMLPTWGKYVTNVWGENQVIFNEENAHTYGRFLGNRYRNKPIIWILGGDRPPDGVEHIWRAMAQGLKEGDGGTHLITYHPCGGMSSSTKLHWERWLDFNMIQSGHSARYFPNYQMIEHDYALRPVKPVLDGEARYEDHPINWNPQNGWFNDYDVRQAAYWALLAGAFGHTYGCHDIWQFWAPGHTPISYARTEWKKALGFPGSQQMGYVRKLMESRPMLLRIPDQSIILQDESDPQLRARAGREADGSYAFVYISSGKEVVIDMSCIKGKEIRAWWYDPRSGQGEVIGDFPAKGEKAFQPPKQEELDWVLVLDDKGKGYPPPGK